MDADDPVISVEDAYGDNYRAPSFVDYFRNVSRPRPEITAGILGVPVERLDAEVASIFEPMPSLWTNERLSSQRLRERLNPES